ncbi:hypothetical protein FXO38_00348 [Capsicum annuum]|nr:hypothetical protein FXO38_00348 [Capsicum annuum]
MNPRRWKSEDECLEDQEEMSLGDDHQVSPLGATVVEGSDYCIITPPEKLNLTEIDTYNDHKIAMVFSLVACAYEPLRTPVVLAKPFPTTLTLSSSRK